MKSTKGDRGQLKKGSSGRGREKTTTRKKRAGEEQRMQKGKDTDVGDRERERDGEDRRSQKVRHKPTDMALIQLSPTAREFCSFDVRAVRRAISDKYTRNHTQTQ